MSLFSERLNKLFDESNLKSVTSFSSYLGIKRETLTFYLNGKRQPDFNMIIHLCEKLNVSADWLLGLSDVRTLDKSLSSACKTLGITEKAALTIMNRSREHECLDTFSLLLETDTIDNLKEGLDYCALCACQAKISGQKLEDSGYFKILPDGKLLFDHLESAKHFASILSMSFGTFLENEFIAKVYETASEINHTDENEWEETDNA